jgi:hypothetical protein
VCSLIRPRGQKQGRGCISCLHPSAARGHSGLLNLIGRADEFLRIPESCAHKRKRMPATRFLHPSRCSSMHSSIHPFIHSILRSPYNITHLPRSHSANHAQICRLCFVIAVYIQQLTVRTINLELICVYVVSFLELHGTTERGRSG